METLTATSSLPETASSTSHHLLNPTSNIIDTANYSNSGVLNQNSTSNLTSLNSNDENSSEERKLKRIKSENSRSNPENMDEDAKPLEKRGKNLETGQELKLEDRLLSVLCCAVCLELPLTSIFQCSQGHLICVACFNHLLADARLKDENPTCPNCRCSISKESCARNLAVERAISEMPVCCGHCNKVLPRIQLKYHENEKCDDRPVNCKYNKICCPWTGPSHEKDDHEKNCSHLTAPAIEIYRKLNNKDEQDYKSGGLLSTILNFLSYEKVVFTDLQLKPYRTEEYVHRLFYETSRFTAFNYHWVIKATINKNEKDPTQSSERKITYALVLKSKTTGLVNVHYFILPGAYGDLKYDINNLRIYNHDFAENIEPIYEPLPLINSEECNRLMAGKVINFRIIMFQKPK